MIPRNNLNKLLESTHFGQQFDLRIKIKVFLTVLFFVQLYCINFKYLFL